MTNVTKSKKSQEHGRRTKVAIEKNAVKELQNLAEYEADLSDTDDARVLALRMYYIELADGVSPNDAQEKVGKMYMVERRAFHCIGHPFLEVSSMRLEYTWSCVCLAYIVTSAQFSFEHKVIFAD